MDTIYIIFDKTPKVEDGGLVATYARFVEEFKKDYNIVLLSVFNNGVNNIKEFDSLTKINLSNFNIDNRFYKAFTYLRNGKPLLFLKALFSALFFFLYIPIAKHKTKKILQGQIVIASCPAAAIFLSRSLKYILEIHINFEYFWGNNLLGKLQGMLIPSPYLVLFRNKTDAAKGASRFNADYIYNGFDDSLIQTPDLNRAHNHSAVFVGRLEPQKNPFMLLECAKQVHKQINDFHLDIYGTGSLLEALKSQIETNNMTDYVHLKGFTNDKSVYSQYEQTWLTSKFEGFGLVLAESMANATPVVTTQWGDAVFEIVKDKETGFIATDINNFSEKAVQLFLNNTLQEKMRKNAHEDFTNRFSMKRNKERWQYILRKTYER